MKSSREKKYRALIACLEYVERKGGSVAANYFAWFVKNKSGLGHLSFGKWMTQDGGDGYFDGDGETVSITERGKAALQTHRAEVEEQKKRDQEEKKRQDETEKARAAERDIWRALEALPPGASQ